MKKFRTPRRRLTRQRSGFTASGEKKGSTCKIIQTLRINPQDHQIKISSAFKELTLPPLFNKNIGIFGIGFYFKPIGNCKLIGYVKWNYNNTPYREFIAPLETQNQIWQKHGAIFYMLLSKSNILESINAEITFNTSAPIDFFGLMFGPLKHPYLESNDIQKSFFEKTTLYIPEILYIDPTTQSAKFTLKKGFPDKLEGSTIICKSCNRCARFLPIDIDFERNTLSFSNHCVSKAPCKHSGFSRYKIEEGKRLAPSTRVESNNLISHYGHQLECKVCKKFFVNSPLNPLRNSTQHREDSLRRRALEVLVNELLERKWIYHLYRLSKGREFDVAIWERFGKKCFKCGAELKTP